MRQERKIAMQARIVSQANERANISIWKSFIHWVGQRWTAWKRVIRTPVKAQQDGRN